MGFARMLLLIRFGKGRVWLDRVEEIGPMTQRHGVAKEGRENRIFSDG